MIKLVKLKISWHELKNKRKELNAYALSNLAITREAKPCQLSVYKLQVVTHADGGYAVLQIAPNCIISSGSISINYSLLFDQDANHRGVILDQRTKSINSYIASPNQRAIGLKGDTNSLNSFSTFVGQGIWHILIGYDHILFVITLLLPAVLIYRRKQWVAVSDSKPALINLTKVITAFTIAHSITLFLAIYEIISLPSRLVESSIALSIILVALNNVRPLFTHARWTIAFLFGLIHGFGFASVLSDLNLNNGSLILTLLGFNVGVEIGQGLIILSIFPLAYWFRSTQVYIEVILKGGSLVIAIVASFWFFQRIIN